MLSIEKNGVTIFHLTLVFKKRFIISNVGEHVEKQVKKYILPPLGGSIHVTECGRRI